MTDRAVLVLEDGSAFQGEAFGARGSVHGEVVFNTSMTGYQEVLTDPSYAGQIVTLTYPIVGNYGINAEDFESKGIQVRGFVVRQACDIPSHWQSKETLSEFLESQDIPGICEVDTRALTRRLRSHGVMMGMISTEMSPAEALQELRTLPRYDGTDFVHSVSTTVAYRWPPASKGEESGRRRIVVLDTGLKYNILRILHQLGCEAVALPATLSAEQILAYKPDGIVLSPGPGDPALLGQLSQTVRELIGRRPIMGICLGHQFIARALGAQTFKLKFGHRGANHPVKDLATGRVYITAQNHGYAVDADGLPPGLEVSHINLNDDTVEGLVHRELPIFSVQYHSEASPGPRDNAYLFERFLAMVGGGS